MLSIVICIKGGFFLSSKNVFNYPSSRCISNESKMKFKLFDRYKVANKLLKKKYSRLLTV